jgi:DNA-binding CsgD family transcriptional regulator
LNARAGDLDRDDALGVAIELLATPLTSAEGAERERLLSGLARLAAPLLTAGDTPLPDADALRQGLHWLAVNLASERPLLVAVDDAHWADRASLRFLEHLASRIDDLPILLLIAERVPEADAPRDLLGRIADVPRGEVLTVGALSTDATAALVRSSYPAAGADLVDACARVTGGNAFLVVELARALGADAADGHTPAAASVERLVPESVMRAVLVRLARLPQRAVRLAVAVSVLGDDVPVGRAAALAGLDGDDAGRAADELAAAHLIDPGAPLRFVHPLVRAAVHADVPAFERSAAHRRAAALLAADGAPVESVAAHLLATEPADDATTRATLRQAAERALRRGDPAAATRLLTRALSETPAVGSLRGEVLVELARAELAAGDPATMVHLNEAVGLLDDPRVRAAARVDLATARYALGDRAGAARECEGALDELPDVDEAILARYLTVASFHADLRERGDARAAPVVEAALAGRPPADPALLAHVALRLALAGHPAATVAPVARLALAGDPLVEPITRGLFLGYVVHGLVCVDELELAESAAARALGAASERGDVVGFSTASFHRALARLHTGDLRPALADLVQAQASREYGWTAGDGWIGELLVHVNVQLGDLAAARSALTLCDGVADDSMEHALGLEARARLSLAGGDAAAALADARGAGDELIGSYGVDHPGLADWRSTAALAAHALGDDALAAALASDAVERARECAAPRALGLALRTAGLVAPRSDGLPLLREAVSVLERSPALLPRASALVALGGALRRAGARTECRAPLLAGLELAERFGAAPLATHARADLHATGARPRRAAVTGVDALTPTERRVADLAAGGASNPQIAQGLFVSVKTVETHLGRAYRKLGIVSREELARALDEG